MGQKLLTVMRVMAESMVDTVEQEKGAQVRLYLHVLWLTQQ